MDIDAFGAQLLFRKPEVLKPFTTTAARRGPWGLANIVSGAPGIWRTTFLATISGTEYPSSDGGSSMVIYHVAHPAFWVPLADGKSLTCDGTPLLNTICIFEQGHYWPSSPW